MKQILITIIAVIIVISAISLFIVFKHSNATIKSEEIVENSLINKDIFWEIINHAKKKSGTNLDRRFYIIQSELAKYNPNDIIQFGQILKIYTIEAENDIFLKAACKVIEGSIDPKVHSAFCFWLISQGDSIYFNALKNPDTLATEETRQYEFCSFEELPYAPYNVYNQKEDTKKEYDMLMSDKEFKLLHENMLEGIELSDERKANVDELSILKLIPHTVPKLAKMYQYDAEKEIKKIENNNDY